MSPQSALALCGLSAVSLLALAGCGGPADPAPTPTPELTVNGLPEGVSLPEDVPTDVPNDPDARADVAISACGSTDGGWRASGVIENSDDMQRTYEVTVFFTTEGGSVIGHGATSVEVAPSGEASWVVDESFVSAETTLCVVRGVTRL